MKISEWLTSIKHYLRFSFSIAPPLSLQWIENGNRRRNNVFCTKFDNGDKTCQQGSDWQIEKENNNKWRERVRSQFAESTEWIAGETSFEESFLVYEWRAPYEPDKALNWLSSQPTKHSSQFQVIFLLCGRFFFSISQTTPFLR